MANAATYKEIPALLAARVPFTGQSMSADWHHVDELPDEGRLSGVDAACYFKAEEWAARIGARVYVVKSYNTVIAWRIGDDGPGMVADQRFSPTTSRQQNLCRAYLLDEYDRAAAVLVPTA